MLTLKQLEKRLKKANRALAFQKSVTKEGQDNPKIATIEKIRSNIVVEVASRQNPANAVRCSLPKKKQRELGMLPPVGQVATVEE